MSRLPLLLMKGGASACIAGLVLGRVCAENNTARQTIFTLIFALIFGALIFGVTRGVESRLASDNPLARIPQTAPLRVVEIGCWVIAFLMWLLLIFVAIVVIRVGSASATWNGVGTLGLALCATGAALLTGRMRRLFNTQYPQVD